MRAIRHAALIGILLAGLAPPAQACGYCIEDRVAAVYDYAVVTRAASQKHLVVFFAMEGAIPAAQDARRTLQGLVESVAGIDRGSVRISVEAASFSAAFNPRQVPLANLERVLTSRFAARGLALAMLRVMDAASPRAPD